MRTKRLISIILGLCMLMVLFTACGTKKTETQTDDATTSTVETDDANSEDTTDATDEQRGGVGDGKYKESPEMAKLVESGEIPPIEERLPKEPAVVTADEIGIYGGTYKGAAFGPTVGQVDTEALRFQSLLTIEKDLETFKPNILKDYKISEDSKIYTLYLREGMRWSNGDPLTSADFMFWYEDVLMNEEITPAVPADWKTNNTVMKMEKVNDYEVTITFADSNPAFEIIMARYSVGLTRCFVAPMEYLKQWHIKYNDKANDKAKEEGFESWALCFGAHIDNSQSQSDINAPDVFPWVLTEIDKTGNKTFTRNPYYFVVDQEGNQLPYIDKQVAVIVQNAEVRTMKLINGELHAAGENPLPVSDYTLYKKNEEKGNYKVYLFENTRGADCAFTFNITHKDPVMREIFNNLKFREAMSLSINRQQINDTLYFGKGTVGQATSSTNVSFYETWMSEYMAEYNVDKANQLLDECGYKWNDAKTVRLMPNGKEFNVVLETIEEFAPVSEMVVEYWNAVGVKTQLKQQERTYYLERGKTGDRDVQVFTLDSVAEFNLRSTGFSRLRPGNAFDDLEFMSAYKDWFTSDGASGEEPPKEIIDIHDDCLRFSTLKPTDPEYAELGKSILERLSKQVWMIGVSVSPRIIIISNQLENTPTEGTFANDYNFWKPYRGDTWYFKN